MSIARRDSTHAFKTPITDTQITDAGLDHLRGLAKLEYLYLEGTQITDAGLKHLQGMADSPHVGHLERLQLVAAEPGDLGVKALASSGHLSSLVSLELSQCNDLLFKDTVSAESFVALFESPGLANLLEISIDHNLSPPYHDGCSFAKALGKATWSMPLSRLKMRVNYIEDEGLAALVGSRNVATLRALEVGFNEFTADGARALADSEYLANLQHLDINCNAVQDKGIKAIAESPGLQGLKSLDIYLCELTRKSATFLAETDKLPELQQLTIDAVEAKPTGVEALRERFGDGLTVRPRR